MLPVPATLPLQTLPSWPAVPDPTALQLLTVTLFIPLAITAVVALFVLGPGWRTKGE
nr:hypothetical protein [Propionicimonas sp.]